MKVLVRMRNSHALRFVPAWNWWKDAYAFAEGLLAARARIMKRDPRL